MIHYGETENAPCGETATEYTADLDAVTCESCKSWFKETSKTMPTPFVPRLLTEYTRRPSTRAPLSEDDLGIVTPENRIALYSGQHPHFKDIDRLPSNDPYVKKHRPRKNRWVSVSAALSWYAHIRRDGFPERSSSSALNGVAELGSRVQSSSKSDSAAIEAAGDAWSIWLALNTAYDNKSDRGLGWDTCVDILLNRAQGTVTAAALGERVGMSAKQIGAIVKSGRKAVRLYLEERDMIPGEIDENAEHHASR